MVRVYEPGWTRAAAIAAAVLTASLIALSAPATASFSHCGNGVIDAGEQCDPGSRKPEDAAACCDRNTCQFKPAGSTCDDDYEYCTADVCNAAGECTHESPIPPRNGCGCCQLPVGKSSSRHADGPQCSAGDEKDCEYAKGDWVPGGICLPSGVCDGGAKKCGDGTVQEGEQCDPGPNGSPCCIDCKYVSAGTACTDDGNVCTYDKCDSVGVCKHINNSLSCNDNQLCTKNDVCSQGVCAGTPFTPSSCNDNNGCTDDVCDSSANGGAGACAHSNNSATCDDQQFCTQNDRCQDGRCNGTSYVPPTCLDSNPCTNDFCNAVLNSGRGGCGHSNNTAACDDGKFCTVNDVCAAGVCTSGPARDCGLGQTCIVPHCDEAADRCANEADAAQNGQSCDDHDACTNASVCANGICGGGAPVSCNDQSACTTDSCDPASGCVFTTVVETPQCHSCLDGVDNDTDGGVDAEDKGCATLAELQRFAVISTATSGRNPLYTGSDVAVDAIAGSTAGSLAPYPIGNTRAGVCAFDGAVRAGGNFGIFAARGVIAFGSGSALDPTLDDPEDDTGSVRSIDMRTEFVSDNSDEIYKTTAPLVGPGQCSNDGSMCTESQASCTAQAAGACCATAGALCNGRLRLSDAANPYVDRSGTADNFGRCVDAMAAMLSDATAIAGLSGNVAGYGEDDNVTIKTGARNPAVSIDVGSGGVRVLEIGRIILAGGTTLTINGPADAVVVIRVHRQLRLGGKAAVLLAGGLQPENVLWNVETNFGGMPNFDREARFSGTVLAPERRGIRCGGNVQISGALFAPRIHLGANTRISHRPFLGLVDQP